MLPEAHLRRVMFAVPNRDLRVAVGAGEKSRTPDLRITNALLYQLSYAGPASCGESRATKRES